MARKAFARSTVKGQKPTFFVILAIILIAALLAAFGLDLPFQTAAGTSLRLHGSRTIRFGIDIRGGVEAVFAPKDFDGKVSNEQLEAAAQVLNFRLDKLQILDREVTASPSSGRIIVRFPWRSDEEDFNPDKALLELGEMALLTFREEDGSIALDGSMVKQAQAGFNPSTNRPIVMLEMHESGKEAFAEVTGRLAGTGKALSIYLDEDQLSSPIVNSKIETGEAIIEGQFTREEVVALSEKINGGSLPFAMEAISSSTISPSLGQNSLRVMAMAGLLAFVLICLFMIVYYRLPGIVGCIALIAQVVGILLAISIPQQTLTLQGIAGIILSIGMGVDANIIIAERIKEEANTGASLPTFLYHGFTRAFSSVMDGNVTVAIAAIVLMIFGSGTVLSFGYSLTVGVILNGITGVWMSRKMIASLSAYVPLQNPSFYGRRATKPQVKRLAFSKFRRQFVIFSLVLLLGGTTLAIVRGIDLSIEFKGGSLVSYDYEGEIDPNRCDDAAQEALGLPLRCQISKGLSDESTRLQVSIAGNEALSPEQMGVLSASLRALYPEAAFEVSSSQLVNPSIGREMLRNGLMALALASLLIIAYVWYSFRSMSGPSAGVMALIALFHDIVLAAISFVLIGSEINETLIAVILTILGFSINNTIVVYDRIRENLPKYRDELGLEGTVDLSISQSLSRSINTSLCIFVAVFIALVYALIYDLDSIREFAVPILVGTVAGTYSSLCISGPFWAWWKTRSGQEVRL